MTPKSVLPAFLVVSRSYISTGATLHAQLLQRLPARALGFFYILAKCGGAFGQILLRFFYQPDYVIHHRPCPQSILASSIPAGHLFAGLPGALDDPAFPS